MRVVKQVVVDVVLNGEIPSACVDGEGRSGKRTSLSYSFAVVDW
jgi:hypothetical protein